MSERKGEGEGRESREMQMTTKSFPTANRVQVSDGS